MKAIYIPQNISGIDSYHLIPLTSINKIVYTPNDKSILIAAGGETFIARDGDGKLWKSIKAMWETQEADFVPEPAEPNYSRETQKQGGGDSSKNLDI